MHSFSLQFVFLPIHRMPRPFGISSYPPQRTRPFCRIIRAASLIQRTWARWQSIQAYALLLMQTINQLFGRFNKSETIMVAINCQLSPRARSHPPTHTAVPIWFKPTPSQQQPGHHVIYTGRPRDRF